MRLPALALALLLAAPPALADSYRFAGGLVMDGDSIATLTRRAGQPTRIVPIENKFGATVGERWEYHLDGKLVTFVVDTRGQIVRIIEAR